MAAKNENTYNNANVNTNNINMSIYDIESLNLLNIQLNTQVAVILSDILSYQSTIEGIKLIYGKYNGNPRSVYNVDILALQSTYLASFTKLIFTQIGFTRYNTLYKKQSRGEVQYSLKPNMDINIGNMLGVLANYYLLNGVIGIYDRDINQPVFGI